MASVVKFDAVFPFSTGIPRDVSVNSFWIWFGGTSGTGPNVTAASEAIANFYCDTPTGGSQSVSHYMSRVINNADARIVAYSVANWATTPALVELGQGPLIGWDGGTGGLGSLPLEVALCASYAGSTVVEGSGGSPGVRSRRGRIYIGPLDGTAVEDGSGGSLPIPDTTFQNTVNLAMHTLHDALEAIDADIHWCVYSRTTSSLTVIDHGWVDNEWDTQRRRGVGASDRDTWSV